MPCPLFLPGSLLPLSDLFSGTCSADPSTALSSDKLTRCCNPGYARAVCPHAAAIDIDSHRFLVRSDNGAEIEIAWASERNHHPVAVGLLTLTRHTKPASDPLEHQAIACAQAYLRHSGQL